jgi:hypothetical protein
VHLVPGWDAETAEVCRAACHKAGLINAAAKTVDGGLLACAGCTVTRCTELCQHYSCSAHLARQHHSSAMLRVTSRFMPWRGFALCRL